MLETQVSHNTLIDQHPAVVYLDSLLTDDARRRMAWALNNMAEMLGYSDMLAVDWSQLRYKDTSSLRSKLIEMYKPSTCKNNLVALRGVLKYAYLLGQMTAEDYREASRVKEAGLGTITSNREPSYKEISALMKACNNDTNAGTRDAAIIALLYSNGIRPTEIVNFDISDYNDGELIIRDGQSEPRIVYVVDGALEVLQDWLTVRGSKPGPLFLAIVPGDAFRSDEPMTSQNISEIMRRRAEEAGIRHITPNDLRKSFITRLLDAEMDIVMVGKITGIKDYRTLER